MIGSPVRRRRMALSHSGSQAGDPSIADTSLATGRPLGMFGNPFRRFTAMPTGQDIAHQSPPVSAAVPVGPQSASPLNIKGTRVTPRPTVDGLEAAEANPSSPLGGSMRQPFDYAAAVRALAGNQAAPNPWRYIAAAVGDTLIANSGGQPWAMRGLVSQRNDQQKRLQDATAQLAEWRYKDWTRQNEADLQASNPFTIGRSRLAYDPATGQTTTIYDGPEDFEMYAQELGLQPGTPEYFAAVEDYVLRSAGPSAHQRDKEIDDYRTANDRDLEGYRYGNRVGLERLRQGNRIELRRTPPARPASASSDLPIVHTPAEAGRLPKGTRFRTPDGKVKVVP